MDYHSSKRNEANNYALEKIKSTISSRANLLKTPFPRIEPIARSGQVFFSNKDEANTPQTQVFGSGLRLSDEDREKTRKRILERLSSNFEKYNNLDTTVDIRRENIINDEDAQKTKGDMILDSLMVRVYNGDVGFDFFNDVLKFKNFIVDNIWKFTDIDYNNYIEKLTLFNRQLEAAKINDQTNALSSIRFRQAIKNMENTGLNSDAYTIRQLENSYDNIKADYEEVITKNVSSSTAIITKLIEYINELKNAIGQTEKNRKSIARALTTTLQINKNNVKNIETRINRIQQAAINEENNRLRDLGLPPNVPQRPPYRPPPPVLPPQPPALPPAPLAQQLINFVDPNYTRRNTEREVRSMTQPELNQFLTNMTGIDGATLINQIGFQTLNDVKSAIVSALFDRQLLIDRRGNLIT
jgi:uncharacterized protein (UPF0333 family)